MTSPANDGQNEDDGQTFGCADAAAAESATKGDAHF